MNDWNVNLVSKGPYLHFIGGKEVEGSSGEVFESIDPSTGSVLARFHKASKQDVDAAVEAARKAFEGPWSQFTPKERSKALLRLAEQISARAESLARMEVLDVGRPLTASVAAMKGIPATLEYYAGILLTLSGQTLNVSDKTIVDFTLREPLGVCGLILPWNYPMSLAILKLAPALAAGNTVVVKPSEVAPLSTAQLGQLAAEAGIPEGVINVVNGDGATTGMALVRHPKVAKISFTGGTETGKTIFREAANSVKRLTLELGGKSPLIVFGDADIDNAVQVAYNDLVRNSGQVCAACTRLIVADEVQEEFLDKLFLKAASVRVGDPRDPNTEMGPLVNAAQKEKVHQALVQASTDGIEVKSLTPLDEGSLSEGGFYVPPTALLKATSQSTVAQDEIFGPVQTVIRFATEEDAVRIANDSRYGLAAAVFTESGARAMRMAKALQAGTVCINHGAKASVDSPFGGYRESGVGKERGMEAMTDDTQIKNVRYSLGL